MSSTDARRATDGSGTTSGFEFLPAAARVAVPWANGGGITREVAVRAGEVGFEWRVSLAEVAGSGPFSLFPEVDRTIVLLSSGELVLDFGADVVALRQWWPHSFPGDTPVVGRLGGATTADLNVMTDRRRWSAVVDVVVPAGPMRLSAADERVVVVLEGRAGVLAPGWSGTLHRLDAVRGGVPLEIAPSGDARLAVVEFRRR